jgi:hypothetical protein
VGDIIDVSTPNPLENHTFVPGSTTSAGSFSPGKMLDLPPPVDFCPCCRWKGQHPIQGQHPI